MLAHAFLATTAQQVREKGAALVGRPGQSSSQWRRFDDSWQLVVPDRPPHPRGRRGRHRCSNWRRRRQAVARRCYSGSPDFSTKRRGRAPASCGHPCAARCWFWPGVRAGDEGTSVATKHFAAVRTEPHVANLGELGKLEFVPQVFRRRGRPDEEGPGRAARLVRLDAASSSRA